MSGASARCEAEGLFTPKARALLLEHGYTLGGSPLGGKGSASDPLLRQQDVTGRRDDRNSSRVHDATEVGLRCIARWADVSCTEPFVSGPEKEYARRRAVIGRCCSNLSRRPSAGYACLSDLTGRFVRGNRNAVYK